MIMDKLGAEYFKFGPTRMSSSFDEGRFLMRLNSSGIR